MTVDVTLRWLTADGGAGGPWPASEGGGVVQVADGLPGDVVQVVPGRRRGRHVTGEVVARLQDSPHRQVPACPVHARCGGCDLAALHPAERGRQLARNAGRQLGLEEGDGAGAVRFVPSPPPQTDGAGVLHGHRARLRLNLVDGVVGYRGHRSHDLVAVSHCGIARPEVNAALAKLVAHSQRADLSGFQAVELRSDGTKVSVHLRRAPKAVDAEEGADLAGLASSVGPVALDGRAVHGDPTGWLNVAGLRLRVSPQSFYQVHLDLNGLLVQDVVARVLAARPERVLDLYAGLGNLSCPIAAATGAPVLAMDREGQAIDDLRFNARAHGLTLLTARTGAVEKLDLTREPFDVAVVDPGRAGTGPVLARLLDQRPRRLVYVSCHLPSATRELRQAQAKRRGYVVRDVACYDLFPDTHHVETVFTLDRADAARDLPAR